MKNRDQFYKELFQREASGNKEAIEKNSGNHYGAFQMGKAALDDVGYYNIKEDKWTGKDGINNLDDFLKNESVQHKAIEDYHQKIWDRQNFSENVGQKIGDVTLDKSGIIAAAHLVGDDRLKKFFSSPTTDNLPKDQNQVLWSEYAQKFSGYNIDSSSQNSQPVPDQQTQDEVTKQQAQQQAADAQKAAEVQASQPTQPELPTAQPNNGVHEVQQGDTLSAIAQKNNTTVDKLLAMPGNEKFKGNLDQINPGDKVNLTALNNSMPAEVAQQPTPTPEHKAAEDAAKKQAKQAQKAAEAQQAQAVTQPTQPEQQQKSHEDLVAEEIARNEAEQEERSEELHRRVEDGEGTIDGVAERMDVEEREGRSIGNVITMGQNSIKDSQSINSTDLTLNTVFSSKNDHSFTGDLTNATDLTLHNAGMKLTGESYE